MKRHDSESVIAIGAGPANLSLAALGASNSGIALNVLEQSDALNWHPGLLVDGARMQTSPLKDLVTPVDPTSPYSFLAYLSEKRRLYRAIVRGLDSISRCEFEDYLRWVSAKLANIAFGERVYSVDIRGNSFLILTDRREYRVRTAVLGVGKIPFLPEWSRKASPDHVFHASELLKKGRNFSSKRVTIVGGGQSGAEIFLYLLGGSCGVLEGLTWVTRRANIFALEDSPFVNEWFFPQFGAWFFEQGESAREKMLEKQVLASDGVSASTLRAIYDALYDREICRGHYPEHVDIHVDTTADELLASTPYCLKLHHQLTGTSSNHATDIIILATGYRNEIPSFLEPIAGRIKIAPTPGGSKEVVLRRDFSARLDGPEECRLYVQNGSRFQHGVADPNLSLVPWRAATVLNSILRRDVYDCGPATSAARWGEDNPKRPARLASAPEPRTDGIPTYQVVS